MAFCLNMMCIHYGLMLALEGWYCDVTIMCISLGIFFGFIVTGTRASTEFIWFDLCGNFCGVICDSYNIFLGLLMLPLFSSLVTLYAF